MGGLQPSDLIVLAGRPGMGKTALATNIAFNIAKSYRGEKQPDGSVKTVNGGIVGFFSLEMSAEQLATRIIAEQSGVPSYKIRRGDMREDDFYKITGSRARDADHPVLHRPDRRHLHRAARRPGAAAEAPARSRPPGHRLHPAPVRLLQEG
jgi:replicative DNA helicase